MIFVGIVVCAFLSIAFSIGISGIIKEENKLIKINGKIIQSNQSNRIYDKEAMQNAIIELKNNIKNEPLIYLGAELNHLPFNAAILTDIELKENDVLIHYTLPKIQAITDDMKEFLQSKCYITPIGYGKEEDGKIKIERITGWSFNLREDYFDPQK